MFEAPFPPYDPTDKTGYVVTTRAHVVTSGVFKTTSSTASGEVIFTHLIQPQSESFSYLPSYETVVKRWPIILTTIIDTVYRVDHELAITIPTLADGSEDAVAATNKLAEGKDIIERVSKLKYEMARDRPLE